MTFRTLTKVLLSVSAVLVVGAGAAVLRVRGRGLPAFPYARPPLTSEEYAALAAKTGWQGVLVPSADGALSLRGLVRAPREPGRPWVLFFQGNSHRLLAEGQEFLDALAGREDMGLAVVSWRGFDGSPGSPNRDALVADASAQVRWLRAHGAGGAPLHLVGFSMGTMPAVAAALEAQSGPEAARPRGLTLLAPFTALQMYEEGRLQYWLTAQDWDLAPLLPGLALPALVVHGSADKTLPVEMGRAVARTIPGARFVEVLGQGHVPLMQDERALAVIRARVLGQKE